MSKNQFRILIIVLLATSLLASFYDYIWPTPIVEQAFDLIIESEPELGIKKLIMAGVLLVVALIMMLVSFIGLLLFKSWARHFYAAGFVVGIALYPFMGITVYSIHSRALYDASIALSGVLLALMYYSPVARYYE